MGRLEARSTLVEQRSALRFRREQRGNERDRTRVSFAAAFSGLAVYSRAGEPTPTTLYAAKGRLIPFNSKSLIGSTFTAFSTFINTRGLMRICPDLASSHSREATLDTVPIERNRSADQLRSSISSPDRMMPLRSMLQFRPERL